MSRSINTSCVTKNAVAISTATYAAKSSAGSAMGPTAVVASCPTGSALQMHPGIVDARTRIGDRELETVIGKGHQQPLVTLCERKSRLTLFTKVPDKSADSVARAVLDLLEPLSASVLTLTSDNGKEFALHDAIAQRLDSRFCFAQPYASWERYQNENANRLIRQYFPKHRNFTTITNQKIQSAMDKLNNRPR